MLAVSSNDTRYKIGDIFYCLNEIDKFKFWKFNGLQIKNIDFAWHKRLWFDWNEWENNKRV